MAASGEVVSVNVSARKGERKTPVAQITVTPTGVEGDAHAGDWHRQISLLDVESIDSANAAAAAKGVTLAPGDFAENVTTRGLDLLALPVGTRLRIGKSVVVEITQHGKECHSACSIRKQIGDCVMPRRGVFARVVATGTIRPGDRIEADA